MKKKIILLNILVILILTSILLFANNKKQKEVIKPTYSAQMMGDVVPDGVIDLTDVGRLYRGMKKIITLTDEERQAGDVVPDGTIDLSDVGRIYRYYINIIDNLVVLTTPTIYTSDNVQSGNTHNIGFLVKLKSSSNIYYCEDTDNTCNPTTAYTKELRYYESTTKYLRYKACDNNNNCSKTVSYKVVLSINSAKGSNSSSSALSNPWQASYYNQGDSRWGSSTIPIPNYKTISAGGCGYVSMAMILTGLTHDYSITPKTVINYLDSSGQWYAMHESDCSGCGGWMYKSAIDVLAKKYNFSHDELFNDYGCSSSKTGCSSSASKDSKIDAMTEALKMGHMLLIDVPNHFVTFISIDANNKIMVFNPATYAWVGSPDYVWSEFYDYNERCTKNGNCGIHSAFEIYPSSGMSLYEWRNIDK